MAARVNWCLSNHLCRHIQAEAAVTARLMILGLLCVSQPSPYPGHLPRDILLKPLSIDHRHLEPYDDSCGVTPCKSLIDPTRLLGIMNSCVLSTLCQTTVTRPCFNHSQAAAHERKIMPYHRVSADMNDRRVVHNKSSYFSSTVRYSSHPSRFILSGETHFKPFQRHCDISSLSHSCLNVAYFTNDSNCIA